MWGCRPSHQVLANTQMVQDLILFLQSQLDRSSLTVQLPQAFEHLKGADANFEMVTSNSIQSIRLFYQHNFVSESVALVLVSTGIDRFKNMDQVQRRKELCRLISL